MIKVGEHITLDIIGTTKEYESSVFERIINEIAKKANVTILNISKYQFEPQGLNAVTRQYFYDSKISSDMASAISIAAQAPRDIDTLEGLSFKAFNKNITSRFKITDDDDDIPGNEARDKLQEDIDSFIQKSNSLNFYLYKLNQGHCVITKGEESLDIPLIGDFSSYWSCQ